jgi:hypothetical protein
MQGGDGVIGCAENARQSSTPHHTSPFLRSPQQAPPTHPVSLHLPQNLTHHHRIHGRSVVARAQSFRRFSAAHPGTASPVHTHPRPTTRLRSRPAHPYHKRVASNKSLINVQDAHGVGGASVGGDACACGAAGGAVDARVERRVRGQCAERDQLDPDDGPARRGRGRVLPPVAGGWRLAGKGGRGRRAEWVSFSALATGSARLPSELGEGQRGACCALDVGPHGVGGRGGLGGAAERCVVPFGLLPRPAAPCLTRLREDGVRGVMNPICRCETS